MMRGQTRVQPECEQSSSGKKSEHKYPDPYIGHPRSPPSRRRPVLPSGRHGELARPVVSVAAAVAGVFGNPGPVAIASVLSGANAGFTIHPPFVPSAKG